LFTHGTSGLNPQETILNLDSAAYFLCEPKELRLQRLPFEFRAGRLSCAVPAIDLHFLDAGFLNLLLPGETILAGSIPREVRSLAGLHEVDKGAEAR
jgi:hypothetical protein